MNRLCPCCGQPIPVKGRRTCALCGKVIGRHDHWNAIGSMIVHKKCVDPKLTGKQPEQPKLLEITQ